jgi:hypothetical protein
MIKWTSVDEDQPGEGWYLVYLKPEKYTVQFEVAYSTRACWRRGGECICDDVTHWAPLPCGPVVVEVKEDTCEEVSFEEMVEECCPKVEYFTTVNISCSPAEFESAVAQALRKAFRGY